MPQNEFSSVHSVKDLESFEDFVFCSDFQDVQSVKKFFGVKAEGFDSFFVLIQDGEYKAVFGMYGIVPLLIKRLYLITA